MQDSFPGAEIFGCFFHLCQNLKKHVGELHLNKRYNNEADFALKAKMITALAFVPINDLDVAFDRLAGHLPVELQPLLQWFEDFYLGRMNRNGINRRPPMFPPAMWNVYSRVLNGQDRTNNYAEAAHRRIQLELAMNHPSVWKLIDGLRKLQKGRDIFFEQMVAGRAPPAKLKKYTEADKRILRIVNDYENRDVLEYLSGLAYNYGMDP